MKTILVPLKLPSDSRPALAIAADLARERKAKLVLLHVVQLGIAGEERGIQRARLLDELACAAETRLRQLAGSLDGPAVEVLVCPGRPADTIVEMASRLEADAVVLRRHSHSRWFNWLHPNTALKVARHAPCRVWLVSPGQHAGKYNLTVVAPRLAGTDAGVRSSASHEAEHSRGVKAEVHAGAA